MLLKATKREEVAQLYSMCRYKSCRPASTMGQFQSGEPWPSAHAPSPGRAGPGRHPFPRIPQEGTIRLAWPLGAAEAFVPGPVLGTEDTRISDVSLGGVSAKIRAG